MKIIRKSLILLVLVLLLGGCVKKEVVDESEIPEQNNVVEGESGGYSIITPFQSSLLRQIYAQNYREIDTIEIGRRLQDLSKEYFSPKNYLVSEGRIITIARYNELVTSRSENNPYGLNPERDTQPFIENVKDSTGKVVNQVTIPNPRFVRSLYEINFYKDSNRETLNAMSVAVVLNRHQIYDEANGLTHAISDESLFQVANDMIGVQLNAYLRTIPELKNVPIMIAFYVQDSSQDNLVGNYLPGKFIGHGVFEGSNASTGLKKNQEAWYLLNSNEASVNIPDTYSNFILFKNKVTDFLSDESIGIVGQAFTINKTVQHIQIDINLGAKTELEIYGLTQYLNSAITEINATNVETVIHVKMFQNSRAIITLNPGSQPVVQFLY